MTKRYYRQVLISEQVFDEWLGLPKGFVVDVAQFDEVRGVLRLRVQCPRKRQFLVPEREFIPETIPLTKVDFKGIRIWHPDLGQGEPD